MAEAYGFTSIATQTADGLVGGDHPPVILPITLLAGARTLARGTVLGRITASGKFTDFDVAHSDGSETAVAILNETKTIGSGADEPATAIFHGVVRSTGLTGSTAAGVLALQARGVYVV